MLDILEIGMEEFANHIYYKYVNLFPKEEQREWNEIETTYYKGIEKFYKIVLNHKTIGFFMLEKLGNDYPFYLDYFAIFEEYQNLGYGTKAIKMLLNRIITNQGVICEIEKENVKNPMTIKRFHFYEKLGFKKFESNCILCNMLYTPIVRCSLKNARREKFDEILFDYYKANCSVNKAKKRYKAKRILNEKSSVGVV